MPDTTAPIGFTLSDPASYGFWTTDVVRWSDLDALGHVNNANFARYCESGRIDYLFRANEDVGHGPLRYLLARLTIDFLEEMHYPGEVRIGSRVMRLGRSSVTFGQGIFVEGQCTGTAEATVVLIDIETRKSAPIPEALRQRLLNPTA